MSIDPLQGLQPQRLWELFGQLLRIPRPSKHEDAVMLFLERWATQHGYTVKRDDVGNRCIHVPATPGGKTGLPIVLQSHVDIVASTEAGAPVPADAAKAFFPHCIESSKYSRFIAQVPSCAVHASTVSISVPGMSRIRSRERKPICCARRWHGT